MRLRERSGLHGRWRCATWANRAEYDRYLIGKKSAKPMDIYEFPNGITDVGIHYLLEVGFRSDAGSPVAQEAPWYARLIDNAGYTGVAAGDTSASHSGWTEVDEYDEATGQTLGFAAAASREITAEVSFTMNATITVKGIFVIDVSTKNASTGTLFSTALFGTAPALVSGNVLTANYTLTD